LYACFKRKLHSEMKVAQLAGYVSEQTAYHHGEASLHSTIVHMAQNFPGSNNVPLLYPAGQFGTRYALSVRMVMPGRDSHPVREHHSQTAGREGRRERSLHIYSSGPSGSPAVPGRG
jgi:hypothetical protein